MTDIETINDTDAYTENTDAEVNADEHIETDEHTEQIEANEQSEQEEPCEADAADEKTPDELDVLRTEISQLREELLKKTSEINMIRGQLGEFSELFPNVAPEDIPEEVWKNAAVSGSLAAAYALYHRRERVRARRVHTLNQKNAESSTGKVGVDAAKEYFTQNEVRAMSRGEVHENYSKILASMKKWN